MEYNLYFEKQLLKTRTHTNSTTRGTETKTMLAYDDKNLTNESGSYTVIFILLEKASKMVNEAWHNTRFRTESIRSGENREKNTYVEICLELIINSHNND